MADDKQTLTDASIEISNGQTIMKFTKIMTESGEIQIVSKQNNFLWAYGSGTTLNYHAARASFVLNVLGDGGTDPTPANPSPVTTAPVPVPAPIPGASKDCTKEFCDHELSPDFRLRYQVNVPDGTTVDECNGCSISMELTYDGEAWLGFAFSEDGQMVGSEAVM